MNAMKNLKHDLPASVVVFFVALPLCLGIALASGAPLFSGLIAGVVGGILVGSLSRSPLGVSGPAAGLAVIVLTAIEALGSFQAFLLAVVRAGMIQVVFGILRAGVLGHFFPSAVIHGMLSGIGIIIFLKQIPHALGYDADPEGDMGFIEADGGTTLSALVEMFGNIHPGAVVLTIISLAILIGWDHPRVKGNRWLSMVPGPVVAVVAAVLGYLATGAIPSLALDDSHLVNVPVATSLSEFAGLFTQPDFSRIFDASIWTVAITIAVVASLETLLSVEATDKMDPYKRATPTNRELLAQGVGNTVSGLLGGLPITQVIVRSTVNVQSGARTRLSAIVHGVLLLLCIASVPHLLNMIPLAVLAAMLLVTGLKLAKPSLFKSMWKAGTHQFVPFIVTVAGVVFTDLLTGVGLGMAVAVIVILQCSYRNSHFLAKQEGETSSHRHIISLQLAQEVTFLNKGAIRKELAQVPDNSLLVIDLSHCVYLNHDVAEIIDDFVRSASARGITVEIIERRTRTADTSRILAAA
ncbi:MAG: SulP family inorganic anion transporter [Gammaproteobacteria bacterium]|nr:SulP family inorganic anion transporter [Gammaproteobacteria bacterium]